MAFTTDGTSGGRAAFAYYLQAQRMWGDVWFETHDIDQILMQMAMILIAPVWVMADIAGMLLLHEVGHALGLSHPFDGGSATQTNLPDPEDNMRTSVMSYTQLDRNLVFNYTYMLAV